MNGHLRIAFLMAVAICLPRLGRSFEDQAEIPLHLQIDHAIAEAKAGPSAEIAVDHEFARRIYLDLIGRSPTLEESRAFLADEAASKRATLIDKLLASEEFDQFFASVLDIIFMERRDGNRIPQAEWIAFLRKSLAEKQPLDQIVRSILSADGTGELRGAAKFLLERQVEPNALTRDISRIFLGRDLQCAQCHDHPNIDDYLQSEYYGIYAFINRSYLFEDSADGNKSYVGEKAEGGTEFKSVFRPDDQASPAIPNLLEGLALDAEPRLDHEQAYVTEPSKTSAGVPRFSRRGQLTWFITHPVNRQFARNAVNRLWAHMLGQGMVDPVDFDHSENPPSHPALLDLLAQKFIDLNFDIRELLRQIALSDAYQRSIEFPQDEVAALAEIGLREQAVESEVGAIRQQLNANDDERRRQASTLETARSRVAQVDERITAAANQMTEVDTQLAGLAKERQDKQALLSQQQAQVAALMEAAAAAKKVAEALPNDAGLAKTRDDYQLRADELSKSIESLQKSLEANEQQRAALANQRSVRQRELAHHKSDRVGLADMVAEARGALRVFESRRRSLLAQQAECRQRLDGLRQEQAYVEAAAGLQKRTQQLAALESMPQVSDAELEAVNMKLAQVRGEIQSKQQELETLTSQSKINTEKLVKKTVPLQELQEAIAHAREAAAAIADEELNRDVELLQEKLGGLTQQLAIDRNQATQLAAEIGSAEQELAQLLTQQEMVGEELSQLQAQMTKQQHDLETARTNQKSAAVTLNLALAARRKLWERKFVVHQLKPLTPEQLAGSTIAALGLKHRFQREAEEEWSKANKDTPVDPSNEQQQREIAGLVDKRIEQVVATYVSLFAAPAGSPQDVFSSTADQALFLSNDGRVQNWLSPGDGTLLGRLKSVDDLAKVANELHLAILARPATDQEQTEIVDYLRSLESDRSQALRDISWGLLSSLEFRFNH